MTLRYPTPAVVGLAGLCALLSSTLSRAAEPSPAAPPVPSAASAALTDLEAQAPKEWKDPAAIAASHDRATTLIETNALQTGDDFYRAAALFSFLNEYRIARMRYELMLAAAAKGHEAAEKSLSSDWDELMNRLGRPHRFDFRGRALKNPEFAEYEPAPDCIQAVWRDPAAARAALAGVTESAEIKAIVDADQADRRSNWSTQTEDERQALIARDKARNVRIREIIAAGEVRTASDYSRAALVLQHSTRFTGFRLAHELAVASLLLGDRSTGRWLVTATYDRMLRSAGLDQRFGTQYGSGGLQRVDESGISDNQRVALGCPTLAQARNRHLPGSKTVSAITQEIVEAGNLIKDAKFGVKALAPAGWTIMQAAPVGDDARSILIQSAKTPQMAFTFYYRLLKAAQPSGRVEAEALLREQAVTKETDRRQATPNYKNRPDSFAFRQANGHSYLSWTADYESDGVKGSEYLVRILGPTSVGLFFVQTPADTLEALKPAMDAMAETVQLP